MAPQASSSNSSHEQHGIALEAIAPASSSSTVPEQAITSDSSLSRSNSPRSVASTAPTSFDHSRSTSHASNVTRSGGEAARSGHHASETLDSIPQSSAPSSSQQDDTVTTPPEDDDHSQSSPPRAESWLSIPRSWTNTVVNSIPRRHLTQNTLQVVGLACTIGPGLVYTYRTYWLTSWQAEDAYYEHCKELEPGQVGFDECVPVLEKPLRKPPFTKRALTGNKTWAWASTWRAEDLLIKLVVLVVSILTVYAIAVLWRTWIRKVTRMWHGGQSVGPLDMWPLPRRRQQQQDPFSPVNVRLAPQHVWGKGRDATTSPTGHETRTTGSEEKKSRAGGMRRRIIPIMSDIHGSTTLDPEVRRKSLKPDKSLYEKPSWKEKGGLKSYAGSFSLTGHESDSDESHLSSSPSTHIGKDDPGTTDDDLMSHFSDSGSTLGNLRRRIHSKYPKLPYIFPYETGVDDMEPPFTALGADDDDDSESHGDDGKPREAKRKNVVLSGFVAMGVSQAGAALASSVGGSIGQEILVRSVGADADMALPMAPQDLSRAATNAGTDGTMGSIVPAQAF